MVPSQSDLLRNAVALDQKLNKGKVSPANTPAKLLFPHEDDPFGGNENNRRAAGMAEKVVPLPRLNEDNDQQSNQASFDETQAAIASPVVAPVAPVAATLTKAQKKAAEQAAKEAPAGAPVWNPNA